MEKKNATLQHELAQLRLLLEEESKAVSQASIGREQVEQLPREELAAAAGGESQNRNSGLSPAHGHVAGHGHFRGLPL
jgi:hypothetical protein